MASLLSQIAAGEIVLCSPQSEPGTDMLHLLAKRPKWRTLASQWAEDLRNPLTRRLPLRHLCRAGDQETVFAA
jgi:hypothetical protein